MLRCNVRSFVLNYLTTAGLSSLSTQALLSLWLLRERRAGPRSSYWPYLQSLPRSYSNPHFCSREEKYSLPEYLLSEVSLQERSLERDYHQLQVLEDVWSLTEFQWAWFTVNTRAVYLDHDPRFQAQTNLASADCLALVPHLDLLNHSGDVSVSTAVDTAGYRIVSLSPVQKYHQAFISYGPHDNTKLLIEYGFYLDNNPHESFNISLEDVLQFGQTAEMVFPHVDNKIRLIRDQGLQLKLSISSDGFTWSLKSVLKIMTFKEESTRKILDKIYSDDDDHQHCSLYLSFLSYLETKLLQDKMQMKNIHLNCSDQFQQCYNLVQSHVCLLDQARTSLT